MATLLGGSRWDNEMTPLDDDWYAYKQEQKAKENPLDVDYISEKYREAENNMIDSTCSTSTAVQNTTCPVCGEPLLINRTTYEKICKKCGYREITTTGDPLSLINQPAEATQDLPDNKPGGLYGWICPKCGAVMSPYTSFCPNCTQRNWEITCTTTNSVPSNIKSNFDVNQFIGGRKDKLGYE